MHLRDSERHMRKVEKGRGRGGNDVNLVLMYEILKDK